jgi:hypothetical protein
VTSKSFKRQQKFIRTSEEWYPTVSGQVRVIFQRLESRNARPLWRVSVWGGDDFGMELDLPETEKVRAQRVYNSIVDFTTQAQLQAMGLERA